MIPVTCSCISYGTGFGGWFRVAYCICLGLLQLVHELVHLVQPVNPAINGHPLFWASIDHLVYLPGCSHHTLRLQWVPP